MNDGTDHATMTCICINDVSGMRWQLPLSRPELRAVLREICRAVGHADASIDLSLVDDAQIAEQNAAFLGCHGPTNVLSFPAREPDAVPLPQFSGTAWEEETAKITDTPRIYDLTDISDRYRAHAVLPPSNIPGAASTDDVPWHMGELSLSVETAVREAMLYHQDPAEHLIRLLAHGTLHLAGYDHGEEMSALTDLAVRAAQTVLPATNG